jgi:uncharacterized protein involved in type VI secretion and phage assembly
MHDCRGDASGMSESGYSGYNALTSESRYGSHSRASRHSREVREAREAREARGEGDSDARWFAHVVRDDHEAQSLIKVRLSLSLSLSLSARTLADRQEEAVWVLHCVLLCLSVMEIVTAARGELAGGAGAGGARRGSNPRGSEACPRIRP